MKFPVKSRKLINYLVLGILLGIFIGTLLSPYLVQEHSSHHLTSSGLIFDINDSVDPSNPTLLAVDTPLYENYLPYHNYYYRTSTPANSSNYHVVGIHQTYPKNDNFDLYLFSSPNYVTPLEDSTIADDGIEWVIFRPGGTQHYYPMVMGLSGSGYAYMEWDQSSVKLSMGSSITNSLTSSECMDLYKVFLNRSHFYKFELDVPEEADFDLFLFYLDPGSAGNIDSCLDESTNSEGKDDAIEGFLAEQTGDHALLIIRWSGSGVYTLTVGGDVIDSFMWIILCIFAGSMSIALVFILRQQIRQMFREGITNHADFREYDYQSGFTESNLPSSNSPPVQVFEPPPPLPFCIYCTLCGQQNPPTAVFCKTCRCEIEN